MKFSRFLLVAAILTVACTVVGGVAQAQSLVDPKIVLGGTGSCAATEDNPLQQTSLTQTFTGLETGCKNDFQNSLDSEQTLFTLVVTVAGGPFELTCDGTTDPNSPLQGPAFQSSPNSCTFQEVFDDAITPGLVYSLTFGTEFGPTVDVTLSQSVITPEPATILLLGTGAMAVVANKRRAKAAK